MTKTDFLRARPANGPRFYGRQEELDRVIRSSDWVWLCAPRRAGKTSMMKRLEERFTESGILALPLNLQYFKGEEFSGSYLLEEFLHSNDVIEATTSRGIEPDDFLNKTKPAVGFQELVKALLQKPGVEGVVFLWDEAELLRDTSTRDASFLSRFTARLGDIQQFRLIVAAAQSLSELSEGADDFIKSFWWYPLGGLEDAAAENLLHRTQTGGWESPLPPAIVADAVHWTGGHPYLLQNLGASLAEATKDGGKRATDLVLADCQAQVTATSDCRAALEDDLLKLTKAQQRVLAEVCKAEGPLPRTELGERVGLHDQDLRNALTLLRKYGYIRANDTVALRFGIFRDLLPTAPTPRATSQAAVDSIRHTVFISYSHKDKDCCQRLLDILKPMLRGTELEPWVDADIESGAKWKEEIDGALDRARVAVLLISADFLASTFIAKEEIPPLLTKASQGGCRILCLHVGVNRYDLVTWDVDGTKTSLAKFQALNDPNAPACQESGEQRDRDLTKAAAKIVHALENRFPAP